MESFRVDVCGWFNYFCLLFFEKIILLWIWRCVVEKLKRRNRVQWNHLSQVRERFVCWFFLVIVSAKFLVPCWSILYCSMRRFIVDFFLLGWRLIGFGAYLLRRGFKAYSPPAIYGLSGCFFVEFAISWVRFFASGVKIGWIILSAIAVRLLTVNHSFICCFFIRAQRSECWTPIWQCHERTFFWLILSDWVANSYA